MKPTFIPFAFLLCAALPVFAQKASTPPAKEKTQNIIIRKKGGDKEKMTIVIDDGNITVNGKPLKDFKGDISITENDGNDFDVIAPLPPLPPAAMYGGAKSYSRGYSGYQNDAFLGVYTEGDDGGAKVSSVTKNSPADKAGFKEGDVITKVDSDNIDDGGDLMDAIGRYKPADKVRITYMRDKKENTITVTLEKNDQQGSSYSFGNKEFINRFKDFSFSWDNDKPRLGARVQDVETGTGVTITNIDDDDSPAAKAGLKEGDVITQINGKTVAAVKDAKDMLADIKRGDNITINYQRKGIAQTATVHIPKPLQSSDL